MFEMSRPFAETGKNRALSTALSSQFVLPEAKFIRKCAIKKRTSSLFCVGRPNRIVICIAIQSPNRRRGVLTELIPNLLKF